MEGVEKYMSYIKSEDYLQEQKETLLFNIVAFLNQKYKHCFITLNLETEIIEIKGTDEDKEKIMEELNSFGLIRG